MAEILVRDLNEESVARLKERAAMNHRSLQAEVRLILEEAANAVPAAEEKAKRISDFREWAAALRAKNAHRPQTDSADLIAEDRDR